MFDFGDGQEASAGGVEDDGGEIMIEEGPAAFAVSAAAEENFEGIVAIDAEAAGAIVAEELIEFGGPLGMSRATEAEAVGKKAGPIFARARVATFVEAGAPEVLSAFFAVGVMSVAPIPGGEGFVVVGLRGDAGGAAVLVGLRGEEAIESGKGEFAGIIRVLGGELGIADSGVDWGNET